MIATAMPAPVSFRLPVLPWALAADDEQRFRRILRRVMGAALVAGLVLPFVPLQPVARTELAAPQPAVVKLLINPAELAKPLPLPVPKPAAEPVKIAEAKPTPEPPRTAPAPAPAPKAIEKKGAAVPEARKPIEGKPPGEVALDNARRRASGVGLLAMKNELAEMTGAPVAVPLRQGILPGPGVGAGSGPGVGAGTEAGLPARAMITANATRGSGGINTAAYSRDTGGGGLAGRATTLVEGVAGGGGGGGPGGSRAGAGGNGTGGEGTGGNGKGGTLTKGGSGRASRSLEDIKLVFERNKGAIYALYNRALRDEPGLQGKVVLELKISPAGQVEGLRLVSSELKAEELEKKLLARIRQFDFGAKDVDVMVVTWPVDFLPS
jgi:TonB family protein